MKKHIILFVGNHHFQISKDRKFSIENNTNIGCLEAYCEKQAQEILEHQNNIDIIITNLETRRIKELKNIRKKYSPNSLIFYINE